VQTRADHWRPGDLGYRFFTEARRLLDREQNVAKITTVQATCVLNTNLWSNGLDELCWPLLHRAINMARQLSLFTPSPESDPMWQKATAITSWSVFNWQAYVKPSIVNSCVANDISLHCFHMFRPPVLREPPLHDLPDPERDMTFYGEVHVRYPGSDQQGHIQQGYVFRALSGFRTILNAVALDLSSSEGDRLPPARLLHYWRGIRDWYSSLPACLAPENIALPSHLKLQ
jgi:hypothetical protein